MAFLFALISAIFFAASAWAVSVTNGGVTGTLHTEREVFSSSEGGGSADIYTVTASGYVLTSFCKNHQRMTLVGSTLGTIFGDVGVSALECVGPFLPGLQVPVGEVLTCQMPVEVDIELRCIIGGIIPS